MSEVVDLGWIAGPPRAIQAEQRTIRAENGINLSRWMVGANFALTLAVFVKLFIL